MGLPSELFRKLNYHLWHQLGQQKVVLSEICWGARQQTYHCHVNLGGEIKAITNSGSSRIHIEYIQYQLYMGLFQVRFRIRGSEKTFLNKDFPLPYCLQLQISWCLSLLISWPHCWRTSKCTNFSPLSIAPTLNISIQTNCQVLAVG